MNHISSSTVVPVNLGLPFSSRHFEVFSISSRTLLILYRDWNLQRSIGVIFGRRSGEAMAKSGKFCFALLLVFLALTTTASVNSPLENSPSWAPEPAAESPLTDAPASSPSESPMSSPPSHPPSYISPNPSPAESPSYPSPDSSPSPSPVTNEASDVTTGDNAEGSGGSEGGMSGGKKAGIAVGVIVGAVLIGVGGMTYKKRRDNIRRTEYRYEPRREIL